MEDQRETTKKKVTFGKARVRLVYYNEDSTHSKPGVERKSNEISRPPPQKPPKSILKSSTKAVSVDSGLNRLHKTTRIQFDWHKMDRDFWEPSKQKKGKKKASLYLDENAMPSDDKDAAETCIKGMNERENDSTEKPEVKNNEKWEGILTSHSYGLTSHELVGIYSGVEADWDQTRLALSRIGVEVGEDRLKNPREFVEIMNKLLSMQEEKSCKQILPQVNQDNAVTNDETHLLDANNTIFSTREQSAMPTNHAYGPHEKAPVIEDELLIAELNATHNSQTLSIQEVKKRIKKLTKISAEKSAKVKKRKYHSKDNTSCGNSGDAGSKEGESTFERFRQKIGKSSRLGKTKTQSNSENDQSSCDSDNTKPTSDNELHLLNRDHVTVDLERKRSFSAPVEPNSGLGRPEDCEQNQALERPKVVKRDSYFLNRKQLTEKKEYSEKSLQNDDNLNPPRNADDTEETEKKSILCENIANNELSIEVQRALPQFENKNDEPSTQVAESCPKVEETHAKQIHDTTTLISEFGNRNEQTESYSNTSSKAKHSQDGNHKEMASSKTTLLQIANQSGSEAENNETGSQKDSGVSTSSSFETINGEVRDADKCSKDIKQHKENEQFCKYEFSGKGFSKTTFTNQLSAIYRCETINNEDNGSPLSDNLENIKEIPEVNDTSSRVWGGECEESDPKCHENNKLDYDSAKLAEANQVEKVISKHKWNRSVHNPNPKNIDSSSLSDDRQSRKGKDDMKDVIDKANQRVDDPNRVDGHHFPRSDETLRKGNQQKTTKISKQSTNDFGKKDDHNLIHSNGTAEQKKPLQKASSRERNQYTNGSNGEVSHCTDGESLAQFQQDISFINRETKRTLRSAEYLERARKRYAPKQTNFGRTFYSVITRAISMNPVVPVQPAFDKY